MELDTSHYGSIVHVDTNDFTYQWQYSSNGGTWTNIGGATNPTYSFTTAEEDSNRKYRVIVTRAGVSKASGEAIIHKGIVGLEDQTVGLIQGAIDPTFATFTVEPQSSSYSYQWEYFDNSVGHWQEIPGQTTWQYVRSVTISDNGLKLRVHITTRTQQLMNIPMRRP